MTPVALLFALGFLLSVPAKANNWPTATPEPFVSKASSSCTVTSASLTTRDATSIGALANSPFVTSPTPSTSANVAAPALSSNVVHDDLIVPIIVLSITLGILLLLLSCIGVFFCMRRHRNLHQHAESRASVHQLTGLGAGTVVEAKEPLADIPTVSGTHHVSAETAFGAGIAPLSVEESGQSPIIKESQNSPQCHVENTETQLTSLSEVVGRPILESHSDAGTEAGPPSKAVSINKFSPGQDEEFHPKVRALVKANNLTKDAVAEMTPVKPKEGTVNPGYNPKLDERRPREIRKYLQDYRILFIIDDSGSMSGGRWAEAGNALSEIAHHAFTFHVDTVEIRFFNSDTHIEGVRGRDRVARIFRNVLPGGGTPTGRVLEAVLKHQIDRLDGLLPDQYASEPPLDIIVLTDGVPDPDSHPAPVIAAAADRLRRSKHHPNCIGIQFVQIDNDPAAKPILVSFIDDPDYDMVDTVSYDSYKEEGGGCLTPEVLERIILGGLHPNLRAYWNQFRQLKLRNGSNPRY